MQSSGISAAIPHDIVTRPFWAEGFGEVFLGSFLGEECADVLMDKGSILNPDFGEYIICGPCNLFQNGQVASVFSHDNIGIGENRVSTSTEVWTISGAWTVMDGFVRIE